MCMNMDDRSGALIEQAPLIALPSDQASFNLLQGPLRCLPLQQ
jgi:hypothetical protein